MEWRRTTWITLAGAVAVAVFFLVAWPLAELFSVAAEQPAVRGERGIGGQVIVNTVAVGVAASLLTVVLGIGAAFVTERLPVVGRGWLRVGFVLPLLVPPFVSALSWVMAYGPGGLTDDLFGLHLPGLYGPVGVVLVIAVNAMPFAYLLAVAALNTALRPEYEVAARASGGRPTTVARTVTLPLLAPALLGAAALVFVVGINAFGIPVILGTPASFETVTTRIYQDLARSAVPEAFSRAVLLAAGLVVLALVFVLVAETLLSRLGGARRSGAPSGLAVRPLRPSRALTAMAWAAIVTVTILPFVALVLVALTRGVGLSPVPGNLTLGNFREALDGGLLEALGRSLSLAVAAATLCLLLGAAVAALQRRRLGRIAGLAGILAFAVPGSTLAVAMLLSYGNALRDTLLLILVAYVAKLWAVSHRSIAGSASGLSPEATRAARSSGASGMTAVRTVVVPPLRPALVAGWLLVFLVAFHELTMSSLLYGPGTETVAVAVLNLQQLGDVPVSSALAVILTLPPLLAAAPILALGRLPRRFLATG